MCRVLAFFLTIVLLAVPAAVLADESRVVNHFLNPDQPCELREDVPLLEILFPSIAGCDCAVFRMEDQVMMIDAGSSYMAEHFIIPFLEQLDIRHIRHRPVDSAITSAMQQLEQRRAPEDAALSVSVSANTRNEKHTQRLRRELEQTVNEHMPIPAPESENKPGMHNSAAEPTRPEDPAADTSVFHPDDKKTPNLQPDRAGNTGIESAPQEPQAGQLPNESEMLTADTPAEGNPPVMQREQDNNKGIADVGEEQYSMKGDSAAALPAPEGGAHGEDASVFDEQAPEHSFGGQQPPEMSGGFGSQQSDGFGSGPSMGGAGSHDMR